MDFTLEQFIGMFHRYNDAVWPAQFIAYGAGLLVVCLLFSRRRYAGRAVLFILAGLWTWLGIVFMLGFQTTISVSGYPFGALFLIGAALLLAAAFRDGHRLGVGRAPLPATVFGVGAIAFALVGYPLVGLAAGHAYPGAPLFGVFPCPTAIFTLGVFLCCARPRLYALIVPLVWCFFATMAAVTMGIAQDFGATAAAVLMMAGLVMVRMKRRAEWSAALVEARDRAGGLATVPAGAACTDQVQDCGQPAQLVVTAGDRETLRCRFEFGRAAGRHPAPRPTRPAAMSSRRGAPAAGGAAHR